MAEPQIRRRSKGPKAGRNGSHVSTQRKKKFCANHVPHAIAASFEASLEKLLHEVAPDFGFKGSYLLREYKSKYLDPQGVPAERRRQAAIEKWLSTEGRNSRTNQRLYIGGADFGWATSDQLIAKASELVARVLGPLRYPAVLWGSWHTNGASTRVRRGPGAAAEKHVGVAHVSSTALTHWQTVAKYTLLEDQATCIMEDSVLFTVDKATDIDRVACKEPELNMCLQRAVGNHIRHSLRKEGIDLNDQTANQELARIALKNGLATIDLSSASDSISTMLVQRLLPWEWYSLLDDLRVKSTVIDGKRHELEMFSSMGNGFTFELESLIFWALAHAIKYYSRARGKVSVYGDDIIVPCSIAPRLARTFAWFGFKVNSKKSHWTGKFRESCGKHYHGGLDVTPFYIKEPVRTKTDIIRLLNHLLDWDGRGWGFFHTEEFAHFHRKWAIIVGTDLFGGQDIDDPTALVTGDLPRKRLVAKDLKQSADQYGRLLYWFAVRESTHRSRREATSLSWATWEVDGIPPLTYTPVVKGRFRTRPNTSQYSNIWDPYFLYG